MPRREPYTWNAASARFRYPETGRYITRAQVRDWVDRNIMASQARIQQLSEELRAGTIDLSEWQRGLREEIVRSHMGAEAMLRGGRNEMTQADYGRVGRRVRDQYRYLNDFTDQLRRGQVRTDGAFIMRSRMYAASARTGFHEGERQQLAALGYSEERNILARAEHCDDCLAETAKGWSPLGSLTLIGTRRCLANDKCTIAFR